MAVNIISLNVRGLRETMKQRAVFDFYRNKCDILCLQETHSTEADEEIWQSEWGGKIMYNHGTLASRRVAICVKKKINCKSIEILGKDGRTIMCEVLCNESKIGILNVYGPNSDSPEFFDNKIKSVHCYCEKLVVVGDFNTVMDHYLDRNKDAPQAINSATSYKLNEICDQLYLQDIWRVRNPDTRRYSWYRKSKQSIQSSRLDYALVSQGLSSSVHNTFYLNGIHTDHSAFFVGLEINKLERGPGYWKLNVTKLYEVELLTRLRTKITELKCDYSKIPATQRWEIIKDNIRSVCQEYSAQTAGEDKIAIANLTEKIIEYEDKIEDLSLMQYEMLQKSKIDLECLQQKRTAGLIFRSQAKWYSEGEVNTKYFLNLEKSRYNAKTCVAIFDDEGTLQTEFDHILDEQRKFYQNLYTSDQSVHFNLPLQENAPLEGPGGDDTQFSLEEVAEAVSGLKNGSCPGPDGLPIEIYKMLWRDLRIPLYEAICEIYDNGIFHDTARTGVLNLIPKVNKDTRYLKNLRPITLLNCDYKIVDKTLANRMVPSLCEIINEDQTGFLPGRRITANIRKILDLSSEEDNAENIVISSDFIKCFDRIEIESVLAAMQHFHFAPVLVKWVKIMYKEFSLKVQNSGWFSSQIRVPRGVHQGGPASNALFLTVAELIATMIRNDNVIESAWIKHFKQLLNQFADDMDVSIKFHQESLNNVLNHFERFCASTGFTLSYDKTTILRIGSLRKSDAKLYTPNQIQWTNDAINVLGVEIVNGDCETLLARNYEQVIQKAKTVLSSWAHRQLSLIGRINVINTLVASLFVYKMAVLPQIPHQYIVHLEEMFNKFMWNGHRPKIPITTLQMLKEDGGLQLVDLKRKDDSMKVAWIKMIWEGMYPAEIPHTILHPGIKENLWICNLHESDVDLVCKTTNVFWKDVLRAWCRLHYSKCQCKDQVVWLNSEIRVQGAPIWWQTPTKRGLMYISDVADSDGYIDHQQISAKYGLTHVAISNPHSKNKPSTVKFPIQINGLSNQFMPVLSEYG